MRKMLVAFLSLAFLMGVWFCRGYIAEGVVHAVAGKSCTVGSVRWEGRKCILENLAMEGMAINETVYELGKRKIVLHGLDLELGKAQLTGKRWGLDLEVIDGRLHVADKILPFSVEPSTLKHHLGTIHFGKRDVIIDLFSQSKEIYAKMTFEKCALTDYGPVISYFTHTGIFTDGEISGHLALGIYRKKMLDHLAADVHFKGAKGSACDLAFTCDEGNMQITMPLDSMGEIPLAKIDWRRILTEFNVKGRLKNASITDEKTWQVTHLSGDIDGTERCFPKVKGDGYLNEDKECLPFKFSAVGEIGGESHMQLSLDLGHSVDHSHVDLSLSYGRRAIQFACDFEDVRFPELRLAQEWLDYDFPVSLTNGTISGSIHGVTEKGRLLSCRLGKVHILDGKGTAYDGDFSAEKIDLSGEYHPGAEPTLSIDVEQGQWRSPSEELEICHGHIRLDDGILDKSYLVGKTRGIDFEITFNGTFHEVMTKGTFAFHSDHRLKQYLTDRHDLSRLVEVKLDGCAIDLRDGWRGEGKLNITYENGENDTIQFHCSKYKQFNQQEAYWKGIDVSFDATNLSHYTYGQFLPEKGDFNVHGTIDVTGEVTGDHIELSVHPKSVKAMTRDLTFELTDAVTEPFHFKVDRATGNISGGGFLLGIKAKLIDLDLDFGEVCGAVMIKDSVLEIQELQSVSNNLFLSGYLVCDMRNCLEKNIQISVDHVQGDAGD
ncbi:MAG: hypothetical protein P0S94_02045, partial [Simkaniaceae bacterium]|nr:hypothetical protein [Simkaniaceae bacterium]